MPVLWAVRETVHWGEVTGATTAITLWEQPKRTSSLSGALSRGREDSSRWIVSMYVACGMPQEKTNARKSPKREKFAEGFSWWKSCNTFQRTIS